MRKKRGLVRMALSRFLGAEKGATAIEYGLVAAGIALAMAAAVFAVGSSLLDFFASLPALIQGNS